MLPPLRERLEEIPLLLEHFVKNFRAEKQKDIVGVSEEVVSLLMKYKYPGNIRELENIIEYGFILCPGGYIRLEHVPETFGGQSQELDSPLLSAYEGLSLEKNRKKCNPPLSATQQVEKDAYLQGVRYFKRHLT